MDMISGSQQIPIIVNVQYSTYLYGKETLRILSGYDNADKKCSPYFIHSLSQAVHGPLQ